MASTTPYTAVYSRLRQLRKEAKNKGQFTGEKPSKLLYGGVAMIALLKDVLDLAVGLIPGVVTVIAFCLTFLIWMLLFLFDKSGGKAKSNRVMSQGIVMTVVGLFEGIGVGLNYLPVETLSVVLLYKMAEKAYKKAMKSGEQAQAAEMRRLNREIASLEAQEAEQASRQEAEAANDSVYEKEQKSMGDIRKAA